MTFMIFDYDYDFFALSSFSSGIEGSFSAKLIKLLILAAPIVGLFFFPVFI